MNIACLTSFAPRKENIDGPTGLLYQLTIGCPSNVSLTLFLANQFGLDLSKIPELNELRARGVQIVDLPRSRSVRRDVSKMFWPNGAIRLAEFSLPKLDQFDVIWGYPYWFAPFLGKCKKPTLVSGMDSATLLFWRKLVSLSWRDAKFVMSVASRAIGNAIFEATYLRWMNVHVVGREDERLLSFMGANAVYIPHPLLAYHNIRRRDNASSTVSILVANAGHSFYGSRLYISWMLVLKEVLSGFCRVRLVLHKPVHEARIYIESIFADRAEVSVETIDWVDDYSQLMSQIDIQLFPLEVGAGTKTSVLTAIQHGVFAVCTPIAAENILADSSSLIVVGRRSFDVASALRAAIRTAESRGPISPDPLHAHQPENCVPLFWKKIGELVEQS